MSYTPLLQRPRTIFIDIDGTILKQDTKWETNRIFSERECEALPGAAKMLDDWFTAGHHIVLVTARPDTARHRTITVSQLFRCGIVKYHRLIMGLPTGQRILINDRKPQEGIDTAVAINLDRDIGLAGVELQKAA